MSLKDKIEYILYKFDEFRPFITKIVDNQKFAEALDNAGTIGGLIKLTVILIDEANNHFVKIEKKAFSELLSIMTKSIEFNFSKPTGEIKIKDIEKNAEFIDSLFSVFINDKWNSRLFSADNIVVGRFIDKIVEILEENKLSKSEISTFKETFKLNFTSKLAENKKGILFDFLQYNQILNQAEDLTNYLHFAQGLVFTENKMDNKFLYEYYIPNKTYLVDVQYWDQKNDEDVPRTNEWNIFEYLSPNKNTSTNYPKDYFIVIGANFGIGKSSFAKYMASEIAERYLKSKMTHIPIYVSLKNATVENGTLQYNNVWGHEDLNDVLNIITSNREQRNKDIVCFMDGLDEITDVTLFYKSIRDYHKQSNFPNMKFIITTRLESQYPEYLQITESRYVRLFSFSDDEVEEFFNKYLLKVDYSKIIEILDKDVLTVPLFCWIAAFTFQGNSQLLYDKIANENSIIDDTKITKTDFYLHFIHSIINGRHNNDHRYRQSLNEYINEKRALRRIAALKVLKSNLTKDDITDNYQFDLHINSKAVSEILSTYFVEEFNFKNKRRIEFIHKSFIEYLLAEFYLESILASKSYYLNLGNYLLYPSEPTLLFLQDMLSIIKKRNGYIYNQFIKSLDNDVENEIDILKKLSSIAGSIVEKDDIVIRKENDVEKEKIKPRDPDGFWCVTSIGIDNYYTLLLHREISLFVLVKLFDLDKKENKKLKFKNKEAIVRLINFSSKSMNKSLRIFSNCNLSNTRLRDADLSHADLSHADLSHADLSHADLSHADLSHADLREADLFEADLFEADLSHAKLPGANLSHASLSYAILFEADLSRSNIIEADLSGANLSHAKLPGANLSHTNLSGANLSHTNLSGANASLLLLIDVERFENLEIDEYAKFHNIVTNVYNVVEFIKRYPTINSKIRVTRVYNKQALKEKLSEGGYADEFIDQILESEILWFISSSN